ncbi:MAG: polysaccharide biosynthesis protein [Clostridia bacterium]
MKGALILAIAGVCCKIFGAFFRIPLSNILGSEGMGLYQMVFPIYSLFLVFVTGGISAAEAKLVAEAKATGNLCNIKRIFSLSLFMMLILGLFFSIALFVLSPVLADLSGNSLAAKGFRMISFAILFSALIAAIRGYFQGFENMVPTAFSQIIEQLIKLIFGLTFASVFVRFGISDGVAGAVFGVLLSEVISFVVLAIYAKKKISVSKKNQYENSGGAKNNKDIFISLFSYSFPMMLGAIILPLSGAIDSFLVVNLLKFSGFSQTIATSLFGISSGMVNSLINLPAIVSASLAISIVPSISFSFAKKDVTNVKNKIILAIKIVLIIVAPCVAGFLVLAPNIMQMLYPTLLMEKREVFEVAVTLLRFSALNIFYIGFLQITTAILQGVSKIYLPVLNLFFAVIVKVALTYALVLNPSLNILGTSLASAVCFMIASTLNIAYLKKITQFRLPFKKVCLPLLFSGIIAAFIALFDNVAKLFFSNTISTFLAIILAIIIYLFFVFTSKVVEKKEIEKVL